jgi:hypothetical protein
MRARSSAAALETRISCSTRSSAVIAASLSVSCHLRDDETHDRREQRQCNDVRPKLGRGQAFGVGGDERQSNNRVADQSREDAPISA